MGGKAPLQWLLHFVIAFMLTLFGSSMPITLLMLALPPIPSVSIVWCLPIEHPPDAFQMHLGTIGVPFPHLPCRFRRNSR